MGVLLARTHELRRAIREASTSARVRAAFAPALIVSDAWDAVAVVGLLAASFGVALFLLPFLMWVLFVALAAGVGAWAYTAAFAHHVVGPSETCETALVYAYSNLEKSLFEIPGTTPSFAGEPWRRPYEEQLDLVRKIEAAVPLPSLA